MTDYSIRYWCAVGAGAAGLLAAIQPIVAAPDGERPPAASGSASLQPRRIDSNVYAVGAVTLDKERGTVSFPVSVNQRSGVVEYAVVTAAGKTHESVFRTEAQPQQIHLAMLLLGARPANTDFFPADRSTPPPGERVMLEVSWKDAGRETRRALEDFVVTTNNHRTLAKGPWAYNGSYLAGTNFVAQRDGSIISVHVDPDALINNPRPGREDDDLHHVNTPALPPEGVPVQLIIRLASRGVRAEGSATTLAPPSDAAALPKQKPK